MDARLQHLPNTLNRTGNHVDEDALIDLRGLMRVIRRRLPIILAISAVMLLIAVAAYVLTPPRYIAQSSVALERGAEQVIKVDQVVPTVDPDSAAVDTEVAVLQSSELAGKVVDRLKLTQDPEFNHALADGTPITAVDARRAAITQLRNNVQVERNGFSYAINVTYQSESPQMAARVVNTIAEIYISNQVQDKSGATRRASKFLEGQLQKLRGQVQSAEAAVAQYRARHGLFEASQNSSVAQDELSGLNTQLAEARAQQAEADARLSTARAQLAHGSTGEELGAALDSPVVSQLRAQRAQTSARVASLRQRYGPRHPDLLNAEEELRDIDDQINGEVKRIVANVSIQANAARQRTASLNHTLNQTEGTLAVNNAASVGLAELDRNAESARVLYQAFLDRYKQMRAQRGLERGNAYIIARAGVPNMPASPKLLVFLVLGIVAAIAASAVAVAIMQLLERGIETSDGVERKLGVASFGSIPDTARSPEFDKNEAASPPVQMIVDRPQSSFSEAFRRLRTSIQFAQPDRDSIVVAVTSALPGEGKTTSAICLARSAALAGARTILVDCDLRRRVSSSEFDPLKSIGLGALLEGKGTLDEAVFIDEASGLYILPRRPDHKSAAQFADSPAFATLIADLRDLFDFVVLDTPPVLPIDDSRVISAKADCVVMLVRWRKTPAKAVEIALRNLDEVGAHVVGASLSMVDIRAQARAGFGDAGYYYNAYKSYYA
ncbi:MAG: polysaccharide biosynthesis tyrosine autokinase [Alphaproteobacteria bacterium]|nr:polysaccharide biosynthesis tyrosine autokinase [Alphaproteobacteria bacterium]